MVARRLTDALKARADGLAATDDRLTLERHLTRWLDKVVKPNVRPATYDSYESIVRVHLVPALGKRRPSGLQPEDVQGFLSDKAAEGRWSARTINYMRRVLSMALGQAVAWGRVSRNVAGKGMVKPARGPARQIQPLDPEQVARLVEATRGRSMEHLILFDLSTGLRKGELLALRWRDVDLVGGWLEVRQELVWRKGRPWSFEEPKSKAGQRVLKLVGPVVTALVAQRVRVAELRLRCPQGAWTDLDLVFPSEVGTPIHPGNVNREFTKLMQRARLPHGQFRPHDLRHGMATHLLEAGVDPRIVMELMGWSQASMLKRYRHVRTAALTDAAEWLESRLAHIPGLHA